MPPEPDADADLCWTAYLYVTGELSGPEEAAFEDRLADDQAAREAVAGAVELAGALASVDPRAWSRPRRHPARRIAAWSAIAAAACLVLASLWTLHPARTDRPDAAEVAMAWTGLRGLESIGGEVEVGALGDDPHPAAELDAATDSAIPSWLLSAAEPPRDDAPKQEN